MNTRPWGGRAANKALRRIKTTGQANSTPCSICHGPIDYTLEYPEPMSCSVQHNPSRNLRPDLTWNPAAWFPAHLVCNQSEGDGTRAAYDLGLTSLE